MSYWTLIYATLGLTKQRGRKEHAIMEWQQRQTSAAQ